MVHEDFVFRLPTWLNENRTIQESVYAHEDWMRELVERYLTVKEIPEYKCKASATWNSVKGNIHHFDVQIGEDVDHQTRTKFQRRVSEFIDNELQLIINGY